MKRFVVVPYLSKLTKNYPTNASVYFYMNHYCDIDGNSRLAPLVPRRSDDSWPATQTQPRQTFDERQPKASYLCVPSPTVHSYSKWMQPIGER